MRQVDVPVGLIRRPGEPAPFQIWNERAVDVYRRDRRQLVTKMRPLLGVTQKRLDALRQQPRRRLEPRKDHDAEIGDALGLRQRFVARDSADDMAGELTRAGECEFPLEVGAQLVGSTLACAGYRETHPRFRVHRSHRRFGPVLNRGHVAAREDRASGRSPESGIDTQSHFESRTPRHCAVPPPLRGRATLPPSVRRIAHARAPRPG